MCLTNIGTIRFGLQARSQVLCQIAKFGEAHFAHGPAAVGKLEAAAQIEITACTRGLCGNFLPRRRLDPAAPANAPAC